MDVVFSLLLGFVSGLFYNEHIYRQSINFPRRNPLLSFWIRITLLGLTILVVAAYSSGAAWVAVLFIIASVFVDRKISFWVSSVGATYFWTKSQDPFVALKAWVIVLIVFAFILVVKYVFHLNVLLVLKGKKRCPMCCEEAYRKAKVCPHCHYNFLSGEECRD